MKIVVLGSGTITPSRRRSASALLVEASGYKILVDIGPGALRRLCDADVDPKLIDFLLITHFHPDHVADLVPFLFASNYAYGEIRNEPFHVIGPLGVETFFNNLVGVYGNWIVPTGNRRIGKEVSATAPDRLEFENLIIRSAPANHHFPSVSYRIQYLDKSVTISGDTDVSDALITLASNSDLFICEASFPDNMKRTGHLTPGEAGVIASKARARKLVLTHFYPPSDEQDVVAEAAREFEGEILKAEDLMELTI